MRYADGGGLFERGRAKRGAVRLQEAEWFAQDVPVAQIAQRLRVSTNAVYVWRRQWWGCVDRGWACSMVNPGDDQVLPGVGCVVG